MWPEVFACNLIKENSDIFRFEIFFNEITLKPYLSGWHLLTNVPNLISTFFLSVKFH